MRRQEHDHAYSYHPGAGGGWRGADCVRRTGRWYRLHRRLPDNLRTAQPQDPSAQQREVRGEVVHDERDLYVAGKAAIFTVRFILAALTVALLASLLVSGARVGPLQGGLGVATAFVSGSYFFSYLLIRKRT